MNVLAWCFGLPGLLRGVGEGELAAEPVEQFSRWFNFARRARVYQPEAFSLATCAEGRPSSRMLLLKGIDARGFVFYTNYESRKGREVEANPRAAMLFFWAELYREIRIEGSLSRVTAEESAAYFHSRLRGSQIGAWASAQSETLDGRKTLIRREREFEEKFKGREVPLPPYWGGYRLMPERIEFWQGRPYRLHDRFVYERVDAAWRVRRLYP